MTFRTQQAAEKAAKTQKLQGRAEFIVALVGAGWLFRAGNFYLGKGGLVDPAEVNRMQANFEDARLAWING